MGLINYICQALWQTILFLLIGVLPWIAVALVMQLLSNSIRKSLAKIFGIQGYIYLTAPGVMIHEIGHAVGDHIHHGLGPPHRSGQLFE